MKVGFETRTAPLTLISKATTWSPRKVSLRKMRPSSAASTTFMHDKALVSPKGDSKATAKHVRVKTHVPQKPRNTTHFQDRLLI
mmetsp:Transcript_78442/g.155401  ORF Transcript_78442/g.155401 Transcript_78442/m.155401 type:complete len:84 (-) Transcript_78442:268-519(-)